MESGMHTSMDSYKPPLSLTILGSIFIGLFGCISIWITFDIIVRKGWRTMMGIMIPVYILNALYLGPLTLWTYWKWGRPPKPTKERAHRDHGVMHMDHGAESKEMDMEKGNHDMHGVDHAKLDHAKISHDERNNENMHHEHREDGMDKGQTVMDHNKTNHGGHMSHAQMHGGGDRPMFATVTIAVCHCGSGCLLGDLVGEWLVFGTGTMINGREIWVEFLLDYGFALIFGIFFQYFSIAPMSGDYGIKTIIRAVKADFLSLTFFEIGLFGWMAIFQIAAFHWKLPMDGVVYWWMMQIGMFLGHWTAFPINYWLIKEEIKEPCA